MMETLKKKKKIKDEKIQAEKERLLKIEEEKKAEEEKLKKDKEDALATEAELKRIAQEDRIREFREANDQLVAKRLQQEAEEPAADSKSEDSEDSVARAKREVLEKEEAKRKAKRDAA